MIQAILLGNAARRVTILLSFCLLALLLAGCGTPLPCKSYVRRGPGYSNTMPQVDRVGVFVDAAVQYDKVSTNYYDLEDSAKAITALTNEVVNSLKSKGYEVAFVEAPFIGGFEPAEARFPVASKKSDVPSLQGAPFITDPGVDSDPPYRAALLEVTRNIHEAVNNRGELPTEQLRASESTQAALNTIATKNKVRYLVVVQGQGMIVSGGKQLGQEIGTALVSGLLSQVTVVAHNVSTLGTTISLVDLQNPEILWCNSLGLGGLNPGKPEDYKSRWAAQVLYWLPPRGQLETPAK